MAARVVPISVTSDHDLLVRLDTKLDTLATQLTEARTLVSNKVDAAAFEPRISKLETKVDWNSKTTYMLIGGLMVAEFVFKYLAGK